MKFEENLSRLTVTVRFQNNESFKNVIFHTFFSHKLVYFAPTFWKSWFHISDNIASVVGDPQYH